MQNNSYDIVIVGAGMVGATLACALAQQTSLSIAIIESQAPFPTWSKEQYQHRVSAIALSSQRIFKNLKVWDAIRAKRVSPFTQIQVWDAHHADIAFHSQEIGEAVLGYIIENNVLQLSLLEKLQQYSHIDFFAPMQLEQLLEKENYIELISHDQRSLKAKLLVAADGAQSWVRKQTNIDIKQYHYEQEAIVATVRTELPHQQIARQVFLASGPLAFLPLADEYTSSIVWSLPISEAKRLKELPVELFKSELAQAFTNRLGHIIDVETRFTFPLVKQQAQQYIKSNLALIGDAAHTIHPLAGQGVNMGLLDAVSLAEIIIDAVKNRRNFASFATLRRYERWRKADNLTLLTGVDAIKQLFANTHPGIQSMRSLGLNATNRMRWIKNVFTRHAVGNRDDLPLLARL